MSVSNKPPIRPSGMEGHVIVAHNELAYTIPPRIAEVREAGGRVVFTNGCFDLIHPGHVFYLRAARSLGTHSSWASTPTPLS